MAGREVVLGKAPLLRRFFHGASTVATAAGLVLMAAAWLNASHYRPWLNFQSEWMAAVGLMLWWAGIMPRRPPGIALPSPAVFLAGLALVPTIQLLSGVIPYFGSWLMATGYLLVAAAAVTAGGVLVSRQHHGAQKPDPALPSWTALFYVPALISALIGFMQWMEVSEVLGIWASRQELSNRPMGNIAQPNQLATLLLFGAVALWHEYEQRRLGGTTAALLVAVLLVVAALTQSRTALLMALAVAGFLALKLKLGQPIHRTAWPIPLVALGAFLALFALAPVVNAALLHADMRDVALTDLNGRQTIWRQLVQAAIESPWLGYGWNQTAAAQTVGAIHHPGSIPVDYAHSLVIDLVVWCGIPAGLLISALAGWWLVGAMRRSRSAASLAAVGMLLALTVHSLLEYPFAYAYFVVAGGIAIGVVEAETASGSRVWRIPPALPRGLAILGLLISLAVLRDYAAAEEDFRVVRFKNLQVGRVPDEYQRPTIHLLTQLRAMLDAAHADIRPGMSPEQLDSLATVARHFPYGALGYRYALALALNGRVDAALVQLRTMRATYGEGYFRTLVDDLEDRALRFPELRELLRRL